MLFLFGNFRIYSGNIQRDGIYNVYMSLSDSGLISTLLIFLMAVVMTYACGRILPAVFLPEKVAAIGNYLPLKHWCNVLETIVTNGNNYSSMKYVLLYGTVFLPAPSVLHI